MIRGPLEYVPPVEVEVATKRKAIPLDENEGIYVRDIKTGKVRRIILIFLSLPVKKKQK
jgi:major vault protein